jgi:hypothetical protein
MQMQPLLERRPPERRPPRRPPEAEAEPAGDLAVESILSLQQTVGNARVTQMLQRQPETEAPTAPGSTELLGLPPELWSEDEVRAIQRELARMRLYSLRVDGDLGPFTRQGLTEAFGGDEWQTIGPDVVLERLGVLDVTLGIGYMEELDAGGNLYFVGLLDEVGGMLEARGFQPDNDRAAEILQAAGRTIGEDAIGTFYVKENALTYSPPAGEPRQIHAIVRVVSNPDNTRGGEAREAFEEGMTQGDVAYYTGHGRYGTGPDFDRNFLSFRLKDADGNVEQELDDYEQLERILRNESHGRGAWAQFQWRIDHDRLEVDFSNAGNMRLVARNMHRGEFGSNLINWALQQTGNEPETGATGQLGEEAAEHPERRYRVLVFDGCRTQDYETSIRSTPGFDTRSADIIETTRETGFLAEAEAFMGFLDGILGRQSAEQVVQGMNQQMRESEEGFEGNPFRASGLGDNPRR